MKIASLSTIATLAAACSTTPSDTLKTRGIWAEMGFTVTGAGTTEVRTTLYVDEPIDLNFIELTGGDELIAVRGSESKTLQETELLNIVGHYASFEGGAEGDELEIQFLRGDGDDAPSSTASIPAPFELDAAPAEASRAEPLTLTWTSDVATELMDWHANGSCIHLASGPIVDAQTVTIPPGTLKPTDEQMPGTCEITIDVIRRRPGNLDAAFKDGHIYGMQSRSVKLTSKP